MSKVLIKCFPLHIVLVKMFLHKNRKITKASPQDCYWDTTEDDKVPLKEWKVDDFYSQWNLEEPHHSKL